MKWLLLLLVLVALPASSESRPRTWVFVAGLVQFEDEETWHHFESRNRRDTEIAQAFKRRGDRVVSLFDREATRENLTGKLSQLLRQTASGDELIVYYQGHGWRDKSGQFYWVPYDGGDDPDSLWPIDEWHEQIQSEFRGDRYVVLSDCCYSGAIAEKAARPARIPWAALASTDGDSMSTLYWTFSDCVLDAVNGNPVPDRNRDGVVHFSELARFVREHMAFFEDLDAGVQASPGFHDPQLFTTARPLRPQEGLFVEVGDKKGRLVKNEGQRILVRWPGTYEDRRSEWLAVD